ncbi:MAG: hypothetical protein EB015_23160 [Methylocystaceae bacterium]|nr:hypothetical protein [Methylocystaceae bacterium]
MRRNVILLLLLNIIIFAYFKWPDAASNNARQTLPELNPDKIQLLSDTQVNALPAVKAPSASE